MTTGRINQFCASIAGDPINWITGILHIAAVRSLCTRDSRRFLMPTGNPSDPKVEQASILLPNIGAPHTANECYTLTLYLMLCIESCADNSTRLQWVPSTFMRLADRSRETLARSLHDVGTTTDQLIRIQILFLLPDTHSQKQYARERHRLAVK